MPGSAAAKLILYNVTRNSFGMIVSVSAGVATTTPPLALAGGSTAWATGDTYQIQQALACNLKAWDPHGADSSSISTTSGLVLFAQITDPSGSGVSNYTLESHVQTNALFGCQLPGGLGMVAYSGNEALLLGCDVSGLVETSGLVCIITSSLSRNAVVCSGGRTNLNGNTILLAGSTVCASAQGGTFLINGTGAHAVAGQVSAQNSGMVELAGVLWGTYSCNASPGGIFWNELAPLGSSWVSLLLTNGPLSFGGGLTGTGSYYTPGTGLWVGGVSLIPANIDTFGGLSDPQTDARFCNTS
jgi:hypothetical protein